MIVGLQFECSQSHFALISMGISGCAHTQIYSDFSCHVHSLHHPPDKLSSFFTISVKSFANVIIVLAFDFDHSRVSPDVSAESASLCFFRMLWRREFVTQQEKHYWINSALATNEKSADVLIGGEQRRPEPLVHGTISHVTTFIRYLLMLLCKQLTSITDTVHWKPQFCFNKRGKRNSLCG